MVRPSIAKLEESQYNFLTSKSQLMALADISISYPSSDADLTNGKCRVVITGLGNLATGQSRWYSSPSFQYTVYGKSYAEVRKTAEVLGAALDSWGASDLAMSNQALVSAKRIGETGVLFESPTSLYVTSFDYVYNLSLR